MADFLNAYSNTSKGLCIDFDTSMKTRVGNVRLRDEIRREKSLIDQVVYQ